MIEANVSLPVIGKTRRINIIGHANGIPAKVDTGADSSSIWASNIRVDEQGMLRFTLFADGSEYYTGKELATKDFKVAQVASSSGHVQIRYRVQLTMRLGGKRIRTLFNLSDRSNNNFPILIGRRTVAGKFLVDVSRGVKLEKRFSNSGLNKELKKDPHAFYKKYHHNSTDK